MSIRTKAVAVGEVASIDRAIESVRERLGLKSRLQVAIVCTLGAATTTFSLAIVMPLAFAAGLLWILWEAARRIAGQPASAAVPPIRGGSKPTRGDASVPGE